ncbi:uncharacterized protein METZ01_LOCUS241693 [marine metagenome]|uniref:Uncharacterized protein n=1 Tax=marine metagenome TaxID=408172 RepID=A0A382HNR0_9ZZZZ
MGTTDLVDPFLLGRGIIFIANSEEI